VFVTTVTRCLQPAVQPVVSQCLRAVVDRRRETFLTVSATPDLRLPPQLQGFTYRPLSRTKLYCLVTEAHVSDQLVTCRGNCRSGVAQAMRHRLQWFIHLRAHGHQQGRCAPRLHSSWGMALIYPFYPENVLYSVRCIYRVG